MKYLYRTTNYKSLIILLIYLWNPMISMGQNIDSFKNYGWASSVKGGKGGKVVKVTTLNANGPGSFLEALEKKGHRVIVFEVGGVIDLKGKAFFVKEPNITILGQTAPSPGITVVNGGFILETHNLILQHIRFRTGTEIVKGDLDVLTTSKNSYDIIIDHCSFMWGIDENLSASGPRFEGKEPDEWRNNTSHRITFSNNIIGEGLSKSQHMKGEHSMGTLVHDNVSDILIMRNLFISNNDRNPLFKGGARGVVLNNLIYNPGIRAISYALSEQEWKGKEKQKGMMTIIGNVLQMGKNTKQDIAIFETLGGEIELYFEDNILYDQAGKELKRNLKGNNIILKSIKPIWNFNIATMPSSEVKNYIYENVGARPWDRDETDSRIINDIKNKKGKIINSEKQVGGHKKVKATFKEFDFVKWKLND
ncbi:hypothetical protein J2X31_002304 [Flavobacterium arsenatis]|uniref:Pectate lyase n=1 Tax=Flavobacterium arsenatis TaxID=1484332 RepID=A0ABU1TRA4_9FLAO|nr:hypothetical protein [Flavobacterium arsenatis]MDR6968287.1 hypothetical protein [Flavobacterium arsenatis]